MTAIAQFKYYKQLLDAGAITLWHPDNTVSTFAASANTDVARGTALNAAFAAHIAGDRIIINPGTYQVASSMTILPGVTVEGSGIGATTIKMGDQGAGAFSALLPIITNGGVYTLDGTTVRGIKFDCNVAGQASSSAAISAVQLYGTNCRIEDCRSINWGSKHSGTECFVFFISSLQSQGIGNVFNNKILRCEVDTPAAVVHNEGASAIGIAGTGLTGLNVYTPLDGWQMGPEISGCIVHDISNGTGSGNVPYFHAFGIAWSVGGLVHHNHASNLLIGAGGNADVTGSYTDTGSQFGSVYSNNTYYNCTRGFYFKAPSSTHFLFQDCSIVNNYVSGTADGIDLEAPADFPFIGNRISGNTVICNSGAVGVDLTNATTVFIENNTIDTNYAHPIRDNGGNTNVKQRHNYKLDGTVISADFAQTAYGS
jgi:hypothetical protein